MIKAGAYKLPYGSALVLGSLLLANASAFGFEMNFDHRAPGLYTLSDLQADWNAPPWEDGVTEGRVSIVSGPEAYSGSSLRVLYPQSSYGWANGAQWRYEFAQPVNEAVVEYRIKFGDGFDFVRGGKIPGLVGGTANGGGQRPNGLDGWSARMMWRVAGKVVYFDDFKVQPVPVQSGAVTVPLLPLPFTLLLAGLLMTMPLVGDRKVPTESRRDDPA